MQLINPKLMGDIEAINFTKDTPYMLDSTLYRYEFEKIMNRLKDIELLKLIRINRLLDIEWDYQNPV